LVPDLLYGNLPAEGKQKGKSAVKHHWILTGSFAALALSFPAGAQIARSDYFVTPGGAVDIVPIHQASLMLAPTSDIAAFATLVGNASLVRLRK
jgi:hypothetical protein